MVSIIIPAFNEENTIQNTIESLVTYLNAADISYELLIVDDGSIDETCKLAKCLEDGCSVKVLSCPDNQGKGSALKFGFERCLGSEVLFFDAGLDFPPRQIVETIRALDESGADIIVGSKRHPQSKVYYPWHRKLVSFAAQLVVRLLFNLGVTDTQVGIKAFRREALEKIMPLVMVKRYAFDIEVLALGQYYGMKIKEVPVELTLRYSTAVSGKSLLRTLNDTLAVFYRLRVLGYYDLPEKKRQRMVKKYPSTFVDKIINLFAGNIFSHT